MDHYDPNSSSHPSQSIPDAAYPEDSPYRPGHVASETPLGGGNSLGGTPLGGSSSHVAITPVSSHQTYTPSQSTIPYSTVSPFDTHPSSVSAAPGNSAPWSPSDPRAQVIPSSPPPPYDPTRVPAAYSPLGDNYTSLTQSAVSDPHIQPTPPASTHYPPPSPSPTSPHSPLSTYPPPSPNPYSAGSSVENGPNKLGPVAEARRRKKRKLQICIVAICAIFLFLVALIVGVALGVLKVQVSNNDDDDRGPPNNVDD